MDNEIRPFGKANADVTRTLHVAIKECTDGIESLKFNTPISKMMEFVNMCSGTMPPKEEVETFVKILSPYAPHIAEELWEKLGHTQTLTFQEWPTWNESALQKQTMNIAVQVSGKMRASIEFSADASKEEILSIVKQHPKIAPRLEGMTIIREIVVPKKLVNLVVKPT